MLEVILDVGLFLFLCFYPGGPPTGFLLDFQPSVDVVSEEAFSSFFEMPDLVDVLDFLSQVHRF